MIIQVRDGKVIGGKRAPTYDFAKISKKLHEIKKIRHCLKQ